MPHHGTLTICSLTHSRGFVYDSYLIHPQEPEKVVSQHVPRPIKALDGLKCSHGGFVEGCNIIKARSVLQGVKAGLNGVLDVRSLDATSTGQRRRHEDPVRQET